MDLIISVFLLIEVMRSFDLYGTFKRVENN